MAFRVAKAAGNVLPIANELDRLSSVLIPGTGLWFLKYLEMLRSFCCPQLMSFHGQIKSVPRWNKRVRRKVLMADGRIAWMWVSRLESIAVEGGK